MCSPSFDLAPHAWLVTEFVNVFNQIHCFRAHLAYFNGFSFMLRVILAWPLSPSRKDICLLSDTHD